jgi:sodium-dependent dicarboxylate transporter 2/3/5
MGGAGGLRRRRPLIAGRPLTAWLTPRVALVALSSARVEAGIAMTAAVLLLLLRVQGRQVLELRWLRRLPFETLLLLGGSLAMAAAIEASGLSAWLGGQLASLRAAPAWAQLLLASAATVALRRWPRTSRRSR